MTAVRIIVAAAAAVAFGTQAHAATPPKADVASFEQLQTPLPSPYDPQADADPKAVDAKIAKAKVEALAQHKLLLIDIGGNWCPDCRILAGTMELPNIKRFVDAHYVEVTVDSGRHMNQNLQIAQHYGQALGTRNGETKFLGVPSVFVVDPATDKLLDAGHTPALSDARHMTPQALADWLAQWVPNA